MRSDKGFTLIELMIVVAIIGLLAAVAVPAYSDYIKSAASAKVVTQFEEAASVVKREYAKIQTKAALGVLGMPVDAAVANFHRDILLQVDPGGTNAPGGGPAYAAVPDPVTGAIGLAPEGDSTDTYAVVLTMPAFNGMPETILTVHYREL